MLIGKTRFEQPKLFQKDSLRIPFTRSPIDLMCEISDLKWLFSHLMDRDRSLNLLDEEKNFTLFWCWFSSTKNNSLTVVCSLIKADIYIFVGRCIRPSTRPSVGQSKCRIESLMENFVGSQKSRKKNRAKIVTVDGWNLRIARINTKIKLK